MAFDSTDTKSGEFVPDLGRLEPLAWSLLEHGAKHGRDAFHAGTLSSVSHGEFPASRTMVLRQVDTPNRLLAAYSDGRAPKVAGLRERQRVSWVFYDARRRMEIRVMGKVSVHAGGDNPVAQGLWQASQAGARLQFATDVASGQRLEGEPLAPRALTAADLTEEMNVKGFANFAVLLTHVERLEILHLHHAGHRRARFDYNGRDLVDSCWIAT